MAKFKDKKETKTFLKIDKNKIFAITVAVVMILSTIGLLINGPISSDPDESKYKDYKFVRTNLGWQTKIKTGDAFFYNPPEQAEFYYIPPQVMQKINNAPYFYMTSDFNSSFKQQIAQAEYDVSDLSYSHKKVYAIPAFLDENPSGVPVITCLNATQYTPVIVFTKSETTKVSALGNCIFFEASSENEILVLRDRLLYGILEIIK